MLDENIQRALQTDMTIDIVTIGRHSGQPRTTEIWFMNLDGRIIICGTPIKGKDGWRTRDWLHNLRANPDFDFCFKESITASVPARATEILDFDDRTAIFSAPQTAWYREQGFSMAELVEGGPVVEVSFG